MDCLWLAFSLVPFDCIRKPATKYHKNFPEPKVTSLKRCLVCPRPRCWLNMIISKVCLDWSQIKVTVKRFILKKKTFISQYGLHMTWHSPTQRHTCCLPSAWCSVNQDSSVRRTLLQSATCHPRCAFAHLNRSRQVTAIGEDDNLTEEVVHTFFVQTN